MSLDPAQLDRGYQPAVARVLEYGSEGADWALVSGTPYGYMYQCSCGHHQDVGWDEIYDGTPSQVICDACGRW